MDGRKEGTRKKKEGQTEEENDLFLSFCFVFSFLANGQATVSDLSVPFLALCASVKSASRECSQQGMFYASAANCVAAAVGLPTVQRPLA